MKLTAEITHDQIGRLLARHLKIDPMDLRLTVDDDGSVTGHVATDDVGLRRIKKAVDKAGPVDVGESPVPATAVD